MWEILAITGIATTVMFAFKSIHGFFLNRRMARNIDSLATENQNFQVNVQALRHENDELVHLKTQLMSEVNTFHNELVDFKAMCDLVGGMSKEAVQNMRTLYHEHRDVLHAHVRSNAMSVLLILDDTLNFNDVANIPYMRRKLSILFDDNVVQDIAFNDTNQLLDVIERLLLQKAQQSRAIACKRKT
jgi:uncharacterized protein YoxC